MHIANVSDEFELHGSAWIARRLQFFTAAALACISAFYILELKDRTTKPHPELA